MIEVASERTVHSDFFNGKNLSQPGGCQGSGQWLKPGQSFAGASENNTKTAVAGANWPEPL